VAVLNPYPGVFTRCQTNISCDPAAANFNTTAPFRTSTLLLWPSPTKSEEDYKIFNGRGCVGADQCAALSISTKPGRPLETLTFLSPVRPKPTTLILKARYFDACAVMLALELLGDCEPRMALFGLRSTTMRSFSAPSRKVSCLTCFRKSTYLSRVQHI
jgi:hypothetical protein